MIRHRGWMLALLTALLWLLCLVSAAGEAHDTPETALKISPGRQVRDQLSEAGAHQYYRFTTAKAGTVTITFTHTRQPESDAAWTLKMADREHIEGQVFGGFSGLLLKTFQEKDAGRQTTCKIGLPKGTWYLRVESSAFTGAEYGLRVNFTAVTNWETEINDSAEEADPVSLNREIRGVLAPTGDFFCRPTDAFVLRLKKKTALQLCFTHGKEAVKAPCWKVSLEDSDLKLLQIQTYAGNSAEEDRWDPILLDAGIYYISVACATGPDGLPSWSEKPYRVLARAMPDQVVSGGGIYRLNHETKEAVFTAAESKTLKTLTIPAAVRVNGVSYPVTEIASKACSGMGTLTKLTIGKRVKTIGAKAFDGCEKLRTIGIETGKLTAKTVGANAFRGCHAKARVTCPAGKAEKYAKILQARGLGSKVKFEEPEQVLDRKR